MHHDSIENNFFLSTVYSNVVFIKYTEIKKFLEYTRYYTGGVYSFMNSEHLDFSLVFLRFSDTTYNMFLHYFWNRNNYIRGTRVFWRLSSLKKIFRITIFPTRSGVGWRNSKKVIPDGTRFGRTKFILRL